MSAVMRSSQWKLGAGAFIALLIGTPGARADSEWLALCNQCINPTVVETAGLGTANAVAQAKVTRATVEAWCANWQPEDQGCVAQELAGQDLNKIYRATADCTAGKITAADGNAYTQDGVWDDSDIGGGRSRWRDASGTVVGRDNASGGLSISQQWELLCPASAR